MGIERRSETIGQYIERGQKEMTHDEINHPAHYQLFPDTEAIDVIRATLTPIEFIGYLKGNALKYRLRAGDKGPAEKCIAKARWYQNRLYSFFDEIKSNDIGDFGQQNMWPEDDSRIDVIGQNGNGGEHYA